MSNGLRHLQARDLRCFSRFELSPDPDVSWIIGPNGSGKTTVLEAAFLAGRGRSFRAARTQTAIRDGAPHFEVVARVAQGDTTRVLGLRGEKGNLIARAAGEPVKSLGDLAQYLPVQVIDARVHELVEGAPSMRRRFLDWGVFHVKHSFLDHWRRFNRALKQRNAALRQNFPIQTIRAWDPELIETAALVDEARRAYLQLLVPHVATTVETLLDAQVSVKYQSGWRAELSFTEALANSLARDQQNGTTHVGPHRADIAIEFSGARAKERASRGQQKLLAASCLLAQSQLIADRCPQRVLLLVDDPAAELDQNHYERLLEMLRISPTQRIITSLNPDIPDVLPGSVFHVEQDGLNLQEML